MSITVDETRSIYNTCMHQLVSLHSILLLAAWEIVIHTNASAAVANKANDPVEIAAYSWIINRQKFTKLDAFTATLTFQPFFA